MDESRREAEAADARAVEAAAAASTSSTERAATPPIANASPPPAPAGASATAGAAVNESAVSNLTAMGFTREQVVAALTACNGDADMAASMLLGQFD